MYNEGILDQKEEVHGMKYIIMALTVMLAAMLFLLEVSKTQATTVDINEIIFEDAQGNIVYHEHVASGASLEGFQLPEGPQRAGYVFVGWSGELPEYMPHADLVYVAIYLEQVLSLNVAI